MRSTTKGNLQRVNVTLPFSTLRLLNRVAKKGARSQFIDQAVRFYIREASRSRLQKELRAGAIARAARDQQLADEWFPIESEE
jgi:CopG family transcriptional regulator/antitoxin EndoAI